MQEVVKFIRLEKNLSEITPIRFHQQLDASEKATYADDELIWHTMRACISLIQDYLPLTSEDERSQLQSLQSILQISHDTPLNAPSLQQSLNEHTLAAFQSPLLKEPTAASAQKALLSSLLFLCRVLISRFESWGFAKQLLLPTGIIDQLHQHEKLYSRLYQKNYSPNTPSLESYTAEVETLQAELQTIIKQSMDEDELLEPEKIVQKYKTAELSCIYSLSNETAQTFPQEFLWLYHNEEQLHKLGTALALSSEEKSDWIKAVQAHHSLKNSYWKHFSSDPLLKKISPQILQAKVANRARAILLELFKFTPPNLADNHFNTLSFHLSLKEKAGFNQSLQKLIKNLTPPEISYPCMPTINLTLFDSQLEALDCDNLADVKRFKLELLEQRTELKKFIRQAQQFHQAVCNCQQFLTELALFIEMSKYHLLQTHKATLISLIDSAQNSLQNDIAQLTTRRELTFFLHFVASQLTKAQEKISKIDAMFDVVNFNSHSARIEALQALHTHASISKLGHNTIGNALNRIMYGEQFKQLLLNIMQTIQPTQSPEESLQQAQLISLMIATEIHHPKKSSNYKKLIASWASHPCVTLFTTPVPSIKSPPEPESSASRCAI